MDDYDKSFAQRVAAKADLRLKAQRNGDRSIWFGFGMLGTIGWSVAIPTVVGSVLGHWWDRRHPGPHSWTLALLLAGLFVGCANAWYWVSREGQAIADELDDK